MWNVVTDLQQRNFDVLGFGVEIITRDQDVLNHGLPFRDAATLAESSILDGLQDRSLGGTRHRSALRFCAAHPGAVAIVISHNRNIRLFYSDNEAVYGFDRLAAKRWL